MVTSPKVLIIDDSNTECLYMQQALQGAGYQAVVAKDGYQGMKLLQQETPQCLVLDIVLPGISGFEVCRQIRSNDAWKDLPIVIVSTKNSSSDRFWAMKQGANNYLPKPFKGEQLVQAVMSVLPERQATPVQSGKRERTSNTGSQQPVVPLPRLVPKRNEQMDPFFGSNPVSVLIPDPVARQLFAAIDGQRDVEKLALALRLTRDDMVRALRILLAQRYILLAEPGGRIIDNPYL